MIFVTFVFLLILFIGGLAYFVGDKVFGDILTVLEAAYPSYYSGTAIDNLTSIVTWSLLFVVLVGGLLWVSSNSQKPRGYR